MLRKGKDVGWRESLGAMSASRRKLVTQLLSSLPSLSLSRFPFPSLPFPSSIISCRKLSG